MKTLEPQMMIELVQEFAIMLNVKLNGKEYPEYLEKSITDMPKSGYINDETAKHLKIFLEAFSQSIEDTKL